MTRSKDKLAKRQSIDRYHCHAMMTRTTSIPFRLGWIVPSNIAARLTTSTQVTQVPAKDVRRISARARTHTFLLFPLAQNSCVCDAQEFSPRGELSARHYVSAAPFSAESSKDHFAPPTVSARHLLPLAARTVKMYTREHVCVCVCILYHRHSKGGRGSNYYSRKKIIRNGV